MKTIKYFSSIFIYKRQPLNFSEFNIYLILEFKINVFWSHETDGHHREEH